MGIKLLLFFYICFCLQKVGLVLRGGDQCPLSDWRGCRRAAWLAPYCPAFPKQTLSSLPLTEFLWLCCWWVWVNTSLKMRPEKDKQSNTILSCHVVFLSFHLTFQRFNSISPVWATAGKCDGTERDHWSLCSPCLTWGTAMWGCAGKSFREPEDTSNSAVHLHPHSTEHLQYSPHIIFLWLVWPFFQCDACWVMGAFR